MYLRHALVRLRTRRLLAWLALPILAACAAAPISNAPVEQTINGIPFSQIVDGYGPVQDGEFRLPPVPPQYLEGVNRRALVVYPGNEPAGTIEIDPNAKFLYWVMPDGMAMRYPIAVGREGKGMSGTTSIGRKAEWPGWTPTSNMLQLRARDLWTVPQRHPGRPVVAAGRAGAVSVSRRARHVLPDPRHQRHELDRQFGLGGVHPDVQPRRHRPLQPRAGRDPGRRSAPMPIRSGSKARRWPIAAASCRRSMSTRTRSMPPSPSRTRGTATSSTARCRILTARHRRPRRRPASRSSAP